MAPEKLLLLLWRIRNRKPRRGGFPFGTSFQGYELIQLDLGRQRSEYKNQYRCDCCETDRHLFHRSPPFWLTRSRCHKPSTQMNSLTIHPSAQPIPARIPITTHSSSDKLNTNISVLLSAPRQDHTKDEANYHHTDPTKQKQHEPNWFDIHLGPPSFVMLAGGVPSRARIITAVIAPNTAISATSNET